MKGQIFILAALAITLAFFFVIPKFQQEIYLPDIDTSQLENIAMQYNKWVAYTSIDNYNILDFGDFVKQNYPHLEFVYLLAENQDLKIANFFDKDLNVSVNGHVFLIKQNSYNETTFVDKIIFNSEFTNFTYIPENNYSGAIFLRVNKGIVKVQLLKIFK
jgi:hypothetical protein